jgi:histidinol-phosphate aminotransferase
MTDWKRLARPSLRDLTPYHPGATRDELKARLGLDHLEPLNWNEDLFGPPQEVLDAAAAELRNAPFYPERAYADFRAAAAAALGVPPDLVIPAHGAQALVAAIAATFLEPGRAAVVPAVTYGLYAHVTAAAGARVVRAPVPGTDLDLDALAARARSEAASVVWVCDPNNPTGSLIDPAAWSAFLAALPPDCIAVADEAYMDFADPAVRADRTRDVIEGRPVVVIRSFSKAFGLAGLRLGVAIADPAVARLLDVVQEPFNVNRAALAAGRAAVGLGDFLATRRAEVAAARDALREALERHGLTSHPSHANFVLVELGVDDGPVCEALLARGVLVRPGTTVGLPGTARVTVAPAPLMERVAGMIAEEVGRAK